MIAARAFDITRHSFRHSLNLKFKWILLIMSKGAEVTGRRDRRKPSQNVSYVEGNSDSSDDDDDDAPPPAKVAKTASSTPASKTGVGASNSRNASKKSPQKPSTTTTKPHDGTKNARGELVFEGADDFRPNRTPKEVLHAGSFGGTYFRPIYSRSFLFLDAFSRP